MLRVSLIIGVILMIVFGGIPIFFSISAASDFKCPPTESDSKGPFYEPDAPVRSSVGKEYVLTGTVKSAEDCSPIPNAKIEFWLANPEGVYDDQHRAIVFSSESGTYRFESSFPPKYGFRPPHIHMRITAEGFKALVTQHYPEKGTSEASFDLVLIPADT